MGLVIYMPHQGSGSAYADILRISTLSAFAVAVPHIPVLFKIFKEIQEKNSPDSLPIQSTEPN